MNSIYHTLVGKVAQSDAIIKQFLFGLTWSCCRIEKYGSECLGFAQSPAIKTRLLQWPGTIAGQRASVVGEYLHSWDLFETTLALSTCNAVVNKPSNPLLKIAKTIPVGDNANLSVFEYFKPQLLNKKIVIIGRYPGLESVLIGLDYVVLERAPQAGDLPDTAAEAVIPEADWVFITGTSLINKTFIRLATLAKNAVTVLMGPTVPWLPEFSDNAVDYIAGVKVENVNYAQQIAMEGGGTRLFEGGVRYAIASLR